jgi:predicted RNA-binding Zn ribbon-like protein
MRFEFIGGALCLDFANTIHDSQAEDNEDELCDISDLLQWAKEAGILSSVDHDRLAAHYRRYPGEAAADLEKARTTRDLLLSIFAGIAKRRSVSPQRLFELNSALAEMPALLRVRRRTEGIETEWMSATDGIPRILFVVLNSAAEQLASDRSGTIRECNSADCTWLFVDQSRNHSRRWCEMRACGNRMKARRHYQRAKAKTNRHKSTV